jgi:hypothetical protein
MTAAGKSARAKTALGIFLTLNKILPIVKTILPKSKQNHLCQKWPKPLDTEPVSLSEPYYLKS